MLTKDRGYRALEEERSSIVFSLVEGLLERLRQNLGDRLVSFVLYGSYARGRSRPESDVDLLIVAEGLPSSSLQRQGWITRILMEVEAPFRPAFRQAGSFPYISANLKTPEEADRIARIYFDMIDEARILFDRGDFFKGVLEKVKKRLEELGARRVQVGEMWYWDLKPDYKPGEVFEI